jgi:hypothetical protein
MYCVIVECLFLNVYCREVSLYCSGHSEYFMACRSHECVYYPDKTIHYIDINKSRFYVYVHTVSNIFFAG